MRELTGGIYFGSPKQKTDTMGLDTMIYHSYEIERIAELTFKFAKLRNKKVCSIDKSNVLNSMRLWRIIVTKVTEQFPDVQIQHMYVDNAAMQLVANPQQFDVLLCPNLFGDILSDEASMITGSLGMLASASLGTKISPEIFQFGMYEPAGGSAPDIVGKNIANPIAQILSLAMLCKYSFCLHKIHNDIVTAINTTLAEGYRTKDIANGNSIEVNTQEMGKQKQRI